MMVFALALLCAFVSMMFTTPYVAQLATRWGAVDLPDGRRKNQNFAVPLGGGLAVAVIAGLTILGFSFVPFVTSAETVPMWLLRGLLPAAIVLVLVGITDDVWSLTGIYKLIGQILAASILVAAGSRFESLSLFGYLIPLGDWCIPFSIFFCLGAINSFNLIDGADALASSVGAIVCLTLGVISAAQGHVHAALVCFAMAGALAGFLRFNLPPARVYLGDTGSMLIGLIVAAVAIECSIKQEAALALVVPLAICAIPILDAGAALIRRITTGQSVFTADRGHLHHVLLVRGWSVGRVVAFIVALTITTCAAALISFFTGHDLVALAVTCGVFAALAATRVFGHSEARLIASHTLMVARKVVRKHHATGHASDSAIQLQGNRKWKNVWSALCEALPRYNVINSSLQINIPRLHEAFYGKWEEDAGDDSSWRMSLPLTLDGQPIGKLSLCGASSGLQALDDLQQLIDFLGTLDIHIRETANDEVHRPPIAIPAFTGGRLESLVATG